MSSVTELHFAASEIGAAMSQAGLAWDHPIRRELEERAVILTTGREAAVRVDGLSLADAIIELRKDPKYDGTFAAPPKTIDHNDLKTLTENFDAVRTGKIVVK